MLVVGGGGGTDGGDCTVKIVTGGFIFYTHVFNQFFYGYTTAAIAPLYL